MIKILRSLIHEFLPLELRFQIELLSRRRDITNKEKQDELLKLLRTFNLDNFVQLGPGTNRYAFRLNGFVIKSETLHEAVARFYENIIGRNKNFWRLRLLCC